jgi:hypothetical protein
MAGLVPAIHVFPCCQDVDARHKAGHDEKLTKYQLANGAARRGRLRVT